MDLILSKHELKSGLIFMGGTGFINDYEEKYYAKLPNKERKSYVKYMQKLMLRYTDSLLIN